MDDNPFELGIGARMQAHADDPSSHFALLQTLRRFGILDDQMIAHYVKEKPIAKQHVIALSGLTAIAVGIMTEEAEVSDAQEMLEELGLGTIPEAVKRAEQALDYLGFTFTDEETAKIRAMFDAFKDLEAEEERET
jgi:hypothetical protein